MSKNTNHSTITFFRLINLLTTATFFLVFLARNNAIEVTIEPDGLLTPAHEFKSYNSLQEFLSTRSRVQHGELVDQYACNIKVPVLQETVTVTTKLGFSMFMPKPAPTLQKLIQEIRICTTGQATHALKQAQIAMLKEILPAAANHQVLARFLANPKFTFIIDYKTVKDKDFGVDASTLRAGANEVGMFILLTQNVFYETSELLGSLRNELASMNAVVANDCRLGFYDTTLRRSSPFALDSNSQKINAITKDGKTSPKIKKIMQAIDKNYNEFIQKKSSFLAMHDGTVEKSDWYRQMITHLKDYIPQPVLFSKNKKDKLSIDYIRQEKKPDEHLDIYIKRDDTQSRDSILYVVPNSYRKSGKFGFGGFEVNPYTEKGKFHWLCELMIDHRKSTLDGGHRDYASRDQIGRYAEWLSFLEQTLNPSLLNFLFPAYCDYMTEYTQLNQDNRNYCAP